MTAGTSPIHHPAHHARRSGVRHAVSIVTSAVRLPHFTVGSGSHAGQMGPVRESEISRHMGSRI